MVLRVYWLRIETVLWIDRLYPTARIILLDVLCISNMVKVRVGISAEFIWCVMLLCSRICVP